MNVHSDVVVGGHFGRGGQLVGVRAYRDLRSYTKRYVKIRRKREREECEEEKGKA